MLTPAEQTAVKRHLGMSSAAPSLYPQVNVFITAGQILSTLPAETETQVRTLLTRLDAIETQLDDARDNLDAASVGAIKLQPEQLDRLWREVKRWRCELSVLTGLPNLRAGRAMMVV